MCSLDLSLDPSQATCLSGCHCLCTPFALLPLMPSPCHHAPGPFCKHAQMPHNWPAPSKPWNTGPHTFPSPLSSSRGRQTASSRRATKPTPFTQLRPPQPLPSSDGAWSGGRRCPGMQQDLHCSHSPHFLNNSPAFSPPLTRSSRERRDASSRRAARRGRLCVDRIWSRPSAWQVRVASALQRGRVGESVKGCGG